MEQAELSYTHPPYRRQPAPHHRWGSTGTTKPMPRFSSTWLAVRMATASQRAAGGEHAATQSTQNTCCWHSAGRGRGRTRTLFGDDRVHVAPALPLRRCGGWHQRLLLLLPLRRCDRCAACQRPALQRRAAASGRRRSERNAEAGGAATSPRPGAERCLLQPPPGKHTGQRTRAEPTARRSSPRAA